LVVIVKVRAHELQTGDRIMGTDLVIESGPTYSQGDIGSDKQRQNYTYRLTNGKSITYNADGFGPQVIRNTEPLEG
jgi:hypothetical protein